VAADPKALEKVSINILGEEKGYELDKIKVTLFIATDVELVPYITDILS
jgi:hypothetical protein